MNESAWQCIIGLDILFDGCIYIFIEENYILFVHFNVVALMSRRFTSKCQPDFLKFLQFFEHLS